MSLDPSLRIGVVTLFPELFGPFVRTSFVRRAIGEGQLELKLQQLREFGLGKHKSVDDTPYGGGAGMVLRADCVVAAVESLEGTWGTPGSSHRVLLTPQGCHFNQTLACDLVKNKNVVLICGRYEGFDDRIRHFVSREISLGDFVMTGGEVGAMAIVETCIRLLPGVLGNASSTEDESFGRVRGGLLEYPQFTRPPSFRGFEVPEVLKSGDHAEIAEWRARESLERTRTRRPDLLEARQLGEGEDS